MQNQNYLLRTNTARRLYFNYCEDLPIVDYHCHINPKDIAEDRRYTSVTELWLEGDHYKWRLMREHGIPEYYITGAASPREKFDAWIKTAEMAIGNPLYQWSRMELSVYFGWDGPLRSDAADMIWEQCERLLRSHPMSARSIIRDSNVKVVCTTDDPLDDLRWHKILREDKDFHTAVLPTFRPDRAVDCRRPDFPEYVRAFEKFLHREVSCYADLMEGLRDRIAYFDSMGCRAADHALLRVPFAAENGDVEAIFKKTMAGEKLSKAEEEIYQYRILSDLACAYKGHGWAMQLHCGADRNVNAGMFRRMGPDTGGDCITGSIVCSRLPEFLNALADTDRLPKTIVYSLNPNDNAYIDSVLNCLQQEGQPGYLQHGAAWWFNDHWKGIREMLETKASMGMLADFIGMLTDSRSLLSYSRHDYFRRVLCQLFAEWIEADLYTDDLDLAGEIARRISLYNAVEYFGFGEYLK